jgi:predicted nucleic acid-binding protein
VRFFDASAIVKRYVRESHSARIRRLLGAGDVALSRLSEIEVVSAFARLARKKAISVVQRDRAIGAFVTDLTAWYVVEITPQVTAAAIQLLTQHPLRSGDAVQVASALVLQEGLGQPLEAFVACDRRVIDAAAAEELTVSTE